MNIADGHSHSPFTGEGSNFVVTVDCKAFRSPRMSSIILRTVVRSLFVVATRDRAVNQAKHFLDRYMQLAEGLNPEAGCQPVEVPPMKGVDEDMRRWSYFMILEHNAIVNRVISTIVGQLVRGEQTLGGAADFDFKKGVMPSLSAGPEQINAFRISVKEHVELLSGLGELRGTRTSPHPIFGDFDAHKWNCMFSFHLAIHYRQAKFVVRAARSAIEKEASGGNAG
jgi:hypothetical protein